MIVNNLNNIQLEKIFLKYIITHQPEIIPNLEEEVFFDEIVRKVFFIIKKFYMRFSTVPTKEQIKYIKNNHKITQSINDEIIDLIFNINLEEYGDIEWIDDLCKKWIKWRRFENGLMKGIDYIKLQPNFNLEESDKIINKFTEFININNNTFNNDKENNLTLLDINAHKLIKENKITTTYKFADDFFNGGYDRKNLVVYIGEPNIGKTIWLTNLASNYILRGYNVVYITLEMSAYKILKRITCRLTNITMNDYDYYSENNPEYIINQIKQNNVLNNLGEIFIKQFPTSQISVLDIEKYINGLLQQNKKIDVVIIDYINLINNYKNMNSENTYLKIKTISEDLRALSIKYNYLVVTASQINRKGFDASDIGMDDIAESIGLVHTADYVYGIIQNTSMYMNKYYFIKVLKARDGNGKMAKCRFNINYDIMRLIETDEVYV